MRPDRFLYRAFTPWLMCADYGLRCAYTLNPPPAALARLLAECAHLLHHGERASGPHACSSSSARSGRGSCRAAATASTRGAARSRASWRASAPRAGAARPPRTGLAPWRTRSARILPSLGGHAARLAGPPGRGPRRRRRQRAAEPLAVPAAAPFVLAAAAMPAAAAEPLVLLDELGAELQRPEPSRAPRSPGARAAPRRRPRPPPPPCPRRRGRGRGAAASRRRRRLGAPRRAPPRARQCTPRAPPPTRAASAIALAPAAGLLLVLVLAARLVAARPPACLR